MRFLSCMAFGMALLASGCSSPDPFTNELLTASIAAGSGRKSVGLISAIGDKFSVQKVGFTVFQNSLDVVPVDTWGIDERIVAAMTAQLSNRFEVKRIGYSKPAFAEAQKSKSVFASKEEDPRYKVAGLLRTIASSQRCDLYVVVTTTGSGVGNTNQSVSGIGILNTSNALFSSIRLHALFDIRVYDGQTFAILGHQRGSAAESSITAVIRGPNREVDKSWWPERPQSIARDTKVKDATLALVEQSVTRTVAELLLKN